MYLMILMKYFLSLILIQLVRFYDVVQDGGPDTDVFNLGSCLCRGPSSNKNLKSTRPYFVDHLMVEFCINGIKTKPKVTKRRDWRQYSGGLLNIKLNQVNWEIDIDDVQEYWNEFESKLIKYDNPFEQVCKSIRMFRY